MPIIASPRILVAIPTRNRPADLRRCLESLARVAYPRWEALVVDQSDDTGARTVVADLAPALPGLQYDHMDEIGLARARNRAMQVAERDIDILAFLDDDCTVPPDWLRQVAAAFARHPDAALVFGAVRAAPHDPTVCFIPHYDAGAERVLRGRLAARRAGGMGASMYLRPPLTRQVGPMDAHTGSGTPFLGEDWDFAYRTLAAGYAVVETPEIAVLHYGARYYASGAARDLFWQNEYARAALHMKLLRCGDPVAILLIAAHFVQLISWIKPHNLLLRRGPSHIGGLVRYLEGLSAGLRLGVDRRRRLFVDPAEQAPTIAMDEAAAETGVPSPKARPTAPVPDVRGRRVLIFSNSFVMGGMEAHITRLACRLIGRGARVDMIYNTNTWEAIRLMLHALEECGVVLHGLPQRRGPRGLLARLRDLYVLTRRLRPDAIHIHSTGPESGELPLLAFKAARPRDCRIVRTDHNPPEEPPSPLAVARLRLRDLLLHRVVVVSRQNRARHLAELHRDPRKTLTIHNGIEPQAPPGAVREEVRKAWRTPPDALVVGMVARLDERRKGADIFLEAVARARTRCPELYYVVVGDGALRPALEAQAARLGLAAHGRFVGARTDVADQLRGLDIFVLPSRYEGLPYTLLEALRAGLPSVAARVGGVDDVLAEDGAYGLVVPPEDPAALAAALVALTGDAGLRARLAAGGPRRIAQDFSIEGMVDRLVGVYGFSPGG